MEQLFIKLLEYLNDSEFKKFKNDFSQKLYNCLAASYANKDNEVTLVTKMSELINKTTFHDFSFFSEKIHGSKSYVEFNFRDKPITKELADMVIISSVSQGRRRIFQKVAFIQNKKKTKSSWLIDLEQLFLLKNFPTITGKKGIFKSSAHKEIVFQNYSKTLGNFGLFMNPGEMILAAACVVDSQKTNNKICINDFKNTGQLINHNQSSLSFLPIGVHPYFDDILHDYIRHFHRYGFSTTFSNAFPFLNNSFFSKDIIEFIDNWCFFNIGEPTIANGNIINEDLHSFSNALLRAAGLNEYLDLGDDDIQFEINGELVVSLMNLQIKK